MKTDHTPEFKSSRGLTGARGMVTAQVENICIANNGKNPYPQLAFGLWPKLIELLKGGFFQGWRTTGTNRFNSACLI
jgi:hypothetical protein